MKRKRHLLFALFLAVFVAMLTGAPVKAASSPKLSKTSLTLVVGKTKTLKVKNTTKKVTWSSSNKKIATVTSSGKVKAVKAGKTTIKAKVAGKTLKCTVKVKNADATATTLTFANKSGGDFVRGVSGATVTFKLNNTSTAVTLKFQTASGTTVFTKTFSKCKANTTYTYTWNGKKKSGSYASAGTYKVVITAGSTKTTSDTLYLYKKTFAGGNGSKSSPYQVSTFSQLKKVAQFNGRYFVQTKDIDGGNANFTPLFTDDEPFTGTYNGKNYTISNLYIRRIGNSGLFASIAEDGVVKNVKMVSCHIPEDLADESTFLQYSFGFIAGENAGTISNCKVSNSDMLQTNAGMRKGGICGTNTGLVESCTTTSLTMYNNYEYSNNQACIAGIVGYNSGGTITSCVTKNLSDGDVQTNGWAAGGIAGSNFYAGAISNCTVSGTLDFDGQNHYVGSIVGQNSGNSSVTDCFDESGSGLNLIGVQWK